MAGNQGSAPAQNQKGGAGGGLKPAMDPFGIGGFGRQVGTVNRQLGGIAQDLISRGQGDTLDPLIENQRGQGLRGLSTQIGRSGVTGSTADNAAARMSSGFDMQQLAGRDQALESGAGLLQGTLQNSAALPALNIGAEAAQNAGGGGGKK